MFISTHYIFSIDGKSIIIKIFDNRFNYFLLCRFRWCIKKESLMNMKHSLNISVVSSFVDRFNTTKLEHITCSANLYANEPAKLLMQILKRKKLSKQIKIFGFSSTGIRKNERNSVSHNQKINSHNIMMKL